MKTIKNDYLLLFLLCFFFIGKAQEPPSSEDYDYDTFEAQKKWIIGTFISDDDSNWQMQFTKDGKCINSYIGDSTEEYTYRIEYSTRKAETPSGYVDDNVYTLYLKAILADPNEDLTYEMAVSDTGLALYPWPMGIGGQFVFSRVKSTLELATPKPTPEPEKEPEVSPKWELKLSDYDRGHFEGGLSYQQCKKEQDKEDRDVFDRDRQMPIESARMRPKAYQAVLDDCRKQAFERIRGESEEYQAGFEKVWNEAEAPVKEKENLKKAKKRQ